MVDIDIYNERRQQLIDKYEDNVDLFLIDMGITITDLVDLVDWEDDIDLAEDMGWTDETSEEIA